MAAGDGVIDGMNDAVVRRRLDALWRMESPKLLARLARIAGNIATAIEQQTSATQEIAKNVQSAASGTHEIAESISEVNRGASETGAASVEVLNSAQTLAVESTRLRQELDRFMANIRAA